MNALMNSVSAIPTQKAAQDAAVRMADAYVGYGRNYGRTYDFNLRHSLKKEEPLDLSGFWIEFEE